MKYRLEIDVMFDDQNEMKKIVKELEKITKKAYKPKGTEKITCFRKARYHHCTHDEPNPKQCGNYTNIDFDN